MEAVTPVFPSSESALILQPFTSESKPNGFTKKCRDCGKLIYLHRGSSDRWRAFEPATEPDEWDRHRCPSGLQDADLLTLIAPAGNKRDNMVDLMKSIVTDLEVMIAQAEAQAEAHAAAQAQLAAVKAAS